MTAARLYLVPIGRSPSGRHGLDLACQLAGSLKGGRIHIIYVVEVNRRLPLDADLPAATLDGERAVANAEEIVRKYKIACDGGILQARDTGHAIIDEAVELGVDAVVLGVSRRVQDGKVLDLGRTADYVLRHAPCDVIIARGSGR